MKLAQSPPKLTGVFYLTSVYILSNFLYNIAIRSPNAIGYPRLVWLDIIKRVDSRLVFGIKISDINSPRYIVR